MQKTYCEKPLEIIFRASRRVSFSYFPNTALNNEGCPLIPLRIFIDHVTIFSLNPMQHLRQLFVTKNGNSWELLLTAVLS